RLRHSGATSELSVMPAAIVQPVRGEREKPVISGTPSIELLFSVASDDLDSTGNSVGEACLPMVACGLGIRAKTTPSPSSKVTVQSVFGRCFSSMLWNISSGGLKEMS